MKLFGVILIFATALHAQCAGACPITLFFSPDVVATTPGATTQPLCHGSQEPNSPQPKHSEPQKEDECGSGPAVIAKFTESIQNRLDLSHPTSVLATQHSGVSLPVAPVNPVSADHALRVHSPTPLVALRI